MATAALFLSAPSLAAQTSTFARLLPGNFVEVLDLQRNSWRRVYQSPAWGTTDLSVGPGGDRIALGLTDPRPRVRVKDPNRVEPYVRYMVYDLASRRVHRAVLGHLKEWSGSGNQRLAEREGRYYVVGAGSP
jgi:hypothetical protein